MSFHVPEKYRVPNVVCGVDMSTRACGNNGKFQIGPRMLRPALPYRLTVVASDGSDWPLTGYPPPAWEHVSVSTSVRCPTWDEMCFVKSLFWDPEDAVFQIHPPRSEYVSNHPYCLHLWRPIGIELPRPPLTTVGPASSIKQAYQGRGPTCAARE